MISYLKGKVLLKSKDYIILLAGGVGYQVFLGKNLLSYIKQGEEREVFVYLKVREDSMSFFGFSCKEDLDFFEQLIGISGVGPKSAIHLIDIVGREDIKMAIIQKRVDILTKAPGLGKKTAERIIVELKGKIAIDEGSSNFIEEDNPEDSDVARALEGLGYDKQDINTTLRSLPEEIKGTDKKIKEALKILGKRF